MAVSLNLWLAGQVSSSYLNNVFAQIGLIVLIGLAARNAIPIVEFARVLRHQGKDIVGAALEAEPPADDANRDGQ